MVIFERFLFSRKLMNDIWHHSIHWKTPTNKHMLTISRSTKKRDWWKNRDEETAKFLSAEWRKKSEDSKRSGIYIGRVAFVYLKQWRKE